MRGEDFMFWSIWMVMILGGIYIILQAMTKRQRIVEMSHKERLAMIERGMVPPAHMAPAPAGHGFAPTQASGATRARLLSGGIMVIAFGVGLILLIGVSGGATEAAFGIGGAIAVLGIALIGIGLVQQALPAHAASMPPSMPASMPPPMPPPPRPDDRFPSS